MKKGDLVTIKYGEYEGKYGKVLSVKKDGNVKLIPYKNNDEPEGVIDVSKEILSVIKPFVFSEEELKGLACAELTYADYAHKIFPAFNVKAKKHCPLLPTDIAKALEIIQKGHDPLSEFKAWFWLIENVFYNAFEIKKRYKKDFFSDAPETEDELFSTVYSLTEELYWKLEERYVVREDTEKYFIKFDDGIPMNTRELFGTPLEEAAFHVVCEDIISRVKVFEFNKGLPKSKWSYSPSQKRHIVMSYEEDKDLDGATEEALLVYKKFVDDLYLMGDVQAMKILAWGHYEGNVVYEQNFFEAEKYLTELYNKTGDPFAANSLGYIYFYGRTSEGEPDYEKAFKFFSYGALAGIDESTYKTGDMLISGQGTVKNIELGLNMIVEGYKDALLRFNDGEYDNKFADYALRMGNACRDHLIYGMSLRDAYKFYLEAHYAIEKRIKEGNFYGDKAVKKKIDAALKATERKLDLKKNKTEVKADFPLFLSHIYESHYPVSVELKKENDICILKVKRIRLIPGEEPKFLVTYPEVSYVGLTSELEYRLEDVGVLKLPDEGDTFFSDGFSKNNVTGAIEFYLQGEFMAAVEAKWFVVDVSKYKQE